MKSFTGRSATDTWVISTAPNRNYGPNSAFRVRLNVIHGMLRIPSAMPGGATRVTTRLRLVQQGAVSGSVTISLRPLTTGFVENRVTWNRQPTVSGPAAVSVTKSNPPSGTVWEFDVRPHFLTWARNNGWRITSSSGNVIRFHSAQASGNAVKPSLYEEWSTAPATPTTISPSDAAISEPKPVVSTNFVDPGDRITAIQVQASPTATAGTAWDSGTVVVTQPRLDLATTSYPGVTLGGTDRYRARVRDSEGYWSGWSAWGEPVTYAPLGSVAVTVPAPEPNNVAWSTTPSVAWAVAGMVQSTAQVTVWDAGRTTKVYESPILTGTDATWEVPRRANGTPHLIDGRTYELQVRVWDGLQRSASAGPSFVEAWRDFTITEDDTVSPPSALSASRERSAPWWSLSWSRGAAPDRWEVVQVLGDTPGRVVAVLDLDDVEISGTTHTWRTATVPPMRDLAYAVRAVEDEHRSEPSPTAALSYDITGVWIVDEESGTHVWLDSEGAEWASEDVASTYRTSNGRTVRSVSALPGLEGTVTGVLHGEGRGWSFEEQYAVLLDFKRNPDRPYRLITSDVNIPVVVGEVLPAPSWRSSNGDRVREVSLSFWQDGESEWDLVV